MTPLAGSIRSPSTPLAGILLGLLLCVAQSVQAQPNLDLKESERGFLSSPDKKRTESDQIEFPQPPREADLVGLDSELIQGRYQYFIDRASVSMGSDEVLRYTVVLESNTGARNVFYEGIRCATSEFRTYAYATRTGEFKPLASKAWRKLNTTGPYDYRRLLADRYVCDRNGWPLKEKQVRERILQNDPARSQNRPRRDYYGPFGN